MKIEDDDDDEDENDDDGQGKRELTSLIGSSFP
jgi:hypothetical protein